MEAPPLSAAIAPQVPAGPAIPAAPPAAEPPPPASDDRPSHDDDDHSDSDGDGESDEEEESHMHWYEIKEDTSQPSEDELKWIADHPERYHSADDHDYWEKQAFFDLDDPEITPAGTGRIEWHVEPFNGTKEKPNKEHVLRSQVVRIGGYDWQLKLYPRGKSDSEYLCVYVDCVSMLSNFEETSNFDNPPFPFLKGAEQVRKRRSVAAQIAVVMYNPAEPRVNEFQSDAHQYHKKSPDYGWKYFTRRPRYEFHHREQFQPRPILQNDKLSFTAYIRVVNDPTCCLWEHDDRSPDQIISITGLRPFTKSLQYIAAAVPLLHFAPFRKFVQKLRHDTQVATWLQLMLLKMYTRKRSQNYGIRGSLHDGDVTELLWRMATSIKNDYSDDATYDRFIELLGTFHGELGAAVGTGRLNTKDHTSIQAAVNNHAAPIARPALLTLELQRQEHDKKQRKWLKITNRVEVEETLTVGGTSYTLYAFITHCGHLMSSKYHAYVRPKGPGKGWYAYQNGKVTRLTEKQARERHSGVDSKRKDSKRNSEIGYDSPFSEFHEPLAEVTSAVMYVRDDVKSETFNESAAEFWLPPQLAIKEDVDTAEKTAVHEHFDTFAREHFHQSDEAAHARAEAIRDELVRAASTTTPEPMLMDGEGDVVMKDADDDSEFAIDGHSATHDDGDLEKGTVDWLGRPYYEGHWKDKVYHGGGHLIASSGDEYLGRFKSGKKHGFGKMIYAYSGDIYEGEWQDDQPHGKGKLTEKNSGNVFEGGFREGKKHGDFVLRGTVTEEDKGCCSICYDREMNTAFYDCGHVVACRECASQIDNCPVCRKQVLQRLQLFGVKISNH